MIVSTAERFKEILRIFVLYFYDWIKQIYQDRYFCLISIRDGKWNSYRVPMPTHPNMTFIDEKQVHEKSKVIKTIFDWYSIFTNWFRVEFFHFLWILLRRLFPRFLLNIIIVVLLFQYEYFHYILYIYKYTTYDEWRLSADDFIFQVYFLRSFIFLSSWLDCASQK